MKRFIVKLAVVLLVLAALVFSTGWYFSRRDAQAQTSFQTAAVSRGDLLVTIDASGTLEPEEVVDVGAQVSGRVVSFGKDASGKSFDYGSQVQQDTVVAAIDDATYQADLSEAQAKLKSAKATLEHARADVNQLKAKFTQAQRDWDRAQKLGPSEALAQSNYDSYQSAYETAKANVEVGQADVIVAEAGVAEAESALWRAQRNLGYCTITSPVTGVVIDRRVNIGQTVTASMSTPSLFLIAKDLHHMRIWVSVNEADIAKIYAGQPVTFTVDALPGQTFRGDVAKVRLNASMTNNVVTYTVEINAANPQGRLLPYMTANVKFEVARRANVLAVPAAAFAFTPTTGQVAPQFRQPPADSPEALAHADAAPAAESQPAPSNDLAASRPASQPSQETDSLTPAVLWVADGQYVRPLPVLTGLSDGTVTEVVGRELAEGLQVVTGVQDAATAAASGSSDAVNNPFTPKLPKPPRGAGGPPR